MVLRIFWDFRIPAGGRLERPSLVRVWPQTHLRGRDLSSGLRRLMDERCLVQEKTPQGEIMVLTATGYARATRCFAGLGANLLSRGRLLLLALRIWSSRTASDLSPKRRLMDRTDRRARDRSD